MFYVKNNLFNVPFDHIQFMTVGAAAGPDLMLQTYQPQTIFQLGLGDTIQEISKVIVFLRI